MGEDTKKLDQNSYNVMFFLVWVTTKGSGLEHKNYAEREEERVNEKEK